MSTTGKSAKTTEEKAAVDLKARTKKAIAKDEKEARAVKKAAARKTAAAEKTAAVEKAPAVRKKAAKKLEDTIQYISDVDCYLFHEGTDFEAYRKMGAHPCVADGQEGTKFTLWAPNAKDVSIITDGNGWNPDSNHMTRNDNGIWEAFLPGVAPGSLYKYSILGADDVRREKADPYAFRSELRPKTASIVCPLDGFIWHDEEYVKENTNKDVLEKPMAIYEVHLGSWKKDYLHNDFGFMNYRLLADQLAEYVNYMGFTHVELIGISEHPFDGSWGYQVTGFFSPTARYGTPDDFRYFVDTMHTHNIGVILDWVPAHFPKDAFGLATLDGTAVYEHFDPLRAEYPEWGTKAFDHGKPEVQSFLISSAFYWINEFHVDALRVDAVAAMLYNSFSRSEWRPNIYGGCENLESMAFLRKLNHEVKTRTRGYLIAEDSSIIKGMTADESDGEGFGFMLKWNMGWMNDTLKYIGKDPIYRGWHHDCITHVIDYTFLENYALVLSHDEVVHLKKSLLYKFPGTIMDKLGGLKTLYTNMFTFPGKKLLFMGSEFAEDREWSEEREINWGLADVPGHRDVMTCLQSLLSIYRSYPVLHVDSQNPAIFEWVNRNDCYRNTFSYIRRNPWNYNSALLIICNYSTSEYGNYTVGAPIPGEYKRIFSTYDALPGCGGPSEVEIAPLTAEESQCDGYPYLLRYNLRAYESVIFEIPTTE